MEPSVQSAVVRGASPDDRAIVLGSIGWELYEGLLAARGETAHPRYTFLQGTLWIVAPSPQHDAISRMFDKLLTAYAEERSLDLRAFGTWTLTRAPERGAEPDESYCLGPRGEVPDLAIEVVWGSEIGAKLEVYRELGVKEVWVWKQDRIAVHVLRDGEYESAGASALLPDLDLETVGRLVTRTDQIAAVREMRAAVRSAR